MDADKLQLQREPAIQRAWVRVLLFLIVFFIGVSLFQVIALVIYGLSTKMDLSKLETLASNPDSLWLMVLLQLLVLVITLLLIWIFRKDIDRKSILSLGLGAKGRLMDMFWGFLTGLILLGSGFLILIVTNKLEITLIQFNTEAVFGGLLFFILVALVEELVFRAYVLSNLMEMFSNKYIALFVSAVLFALFHSLNPNLNLLAMLNLMLAGLSLGITYIYTKNIWFPVFLHISWNYFQGPIFGFEVSGMVTKSVIEHKLIGSDFITGGKFGFEGSILISVLLIAMIVFADTFLRKKRNQQSHG